MEQKLGLGRIVISAIGLIAVVILLIFAGKVFESVSANEISVIQDPIDGELHWYVSQGIKWQGLGKVTSYYKRSVYEFVCRESHRVEVKEIDPNTKEERKIEREECIPGQNTSINVRFNDGGHGRMHGSIQYELPLDAPHLTELHTRFGNQEAIQKQLIETVVNKSVYMTGPLMSSKESYAEKRNDLIRLVEDQVAHGVYRTVSREAKIKDSITGTDKTVTVVEIVMKDGIPDRQEEAVLTQFGIKSFNFSLTALIYDDTIENQIKEQQKISMDVQTAIADAKKAEQRAITVAKEGEANAAKAKWDQEVVKAKEVTAAEQRKEVAKLDKDAAEFNKQKLILEGQGEAEKKRLVMNADGALEIKLNTYERVMAKFASEFAKQKWVPELQMGTNGSANGNAAVDMINLLTIKTAKDLGLDMKAR